MAAIRCRETTCPGATPAPRRDTYMRKGGRERTCFNLDRHPAARYATAMFDLAEEEGALAALESDVAALEGRLGRKRRTARR